MEYLIILILLTISLYIWLKKILDKAFVKIRINYEQLKNEYDRLYFYNSDLKQKNIHLQSILEETLALYDITKDICRTLDKDRIFGVFSARIDKYIKVSDCKFLSEDTDLDKYKNYTLIPLKLDRQTIGYLATREIKEEDRDKFYILGQQFILGIRRAFLYERLQELAITDSLTGIFSRRYCLERLQEEIERSKKFGYRFSSLMLDIDHFKSYNDRYGHLVGDGILREISGVIKENIRQIDLISRYGGEEFLIILTQTDKKQAQSAAQRIRKSIEDKQIKVYDEEIKITVSIGISTFPDDAKETLRLIERADQALYQAKETGRNRVCVYGVK